MDKTFWLYHQNHACPTLKCMCSAAVSSESQHTNCASQNRTCQILNSYHAIVTVSWSAPSVIGHKISKMKKAATRELHYKLVHLF